MLERVNKLLGTRFTELNWVEISYYQVLSEDFIREFKDKVYWKQISYKQVLSEDFIREFQDKVYWVNISYKQELSLEFIKEFEDKVDWNILKEKGLSKIIVNNLTLVNKL